MCFFCRELKARHVENPIVAQLLRASTSVFANVNEAHYAQGRRDFVSKLSISLKECNECDGWFELLFNTDSISKEEYDSFHNRCVEISRVLSCSIRTAKKNLLSGSC